MGLKSFLGIDCTEAATACNKAEYQEVNLLEKFRLKVHLAVCSGCREYHHKNQKLSQVLKKAKLESCSEAEKAAFRQRMKRKSSDEI